MKAAAIDSISFLVDDQFARRPSPNLKRVISTCGSRQAREARKSHEMTRKHSMARSRESLSNKLIHVEKWTNMCNRSQERERRRRWPHVTRRRTMLLFREISCDFRVPSRCREPKVETLRLRSAKVGAPTSSPIKVNLKANCDDLQAEQQAQRFSRVSDSATRRALVYRAKRLWSESPLHSCKSQDLARHQIPAANRPVRGFLLYI